MVIYKSESRTIIWVAPKAVMARSMQMPNIFVEGTLVAYLLEDVRRRAIIYFQDGFPFCIGNPKYIIRGERDFKMLPKKAKAAGRSKEELVDSVCYVIAEQ
jgi:hypothetical protein